MVITLAAKSIRTWTADLVSWVRFPAEAKAFFQPKGDQMKTGSTSTEPVDTQNS